MAPSSQQPARQSAPDLSIGTGETVGIHPSGYTEPISRRQDGERELIETMARFRKAPFDFFREVSLHVSGTGWRSYEHPVGPPVFYSGFSNEMKERVVQSPMLLDKIHELARKRVDTEEKEGLLENLGGREKRCREIRASLLGVAEDMTDKMICKMESKRFLRGAYYVATQLLTRAYQSGIHVSSEEVLRLHAVAAEAAKKKQSIIFLPCHRSHVDYVSLLIVCYRLGLSLPTIVAGDNLNFPLVGPFLQHIGAMFIRRSFGDDQLYGTVVQAYVDTLLQGGYNFGCFIEGGRSRTGKLLPPKFGILRFLLDSVLSGRVEDAIVCPISTQYDKVIEVDSYISELLGQPKKKENLQDFFSASSVLSMKLGRVDMRFHEPWSMRDFINDQFGRYVGAPGRVPTPDDWDAENKLRLLRTMGYKVLSEINDVSVVMPSALCGTVLLTLRGRGVGKSELIRRVDWLRCRIIERGGRVAHFAGLPTEVVVNKALDVLGPELVGTLKNLPEETYYAVDRYTTPSHTERTEHN
jgi:1-acyl-sn-glycerol-3-phosphate acyltransferase